MAKPSNIYDIIICGAGISGLALAYYLYKEFPQKSVLIIDSNRKKEMTLSCWTKFSDDFNEIIVNKWKNINIKFGKKSISYRTKNFEYRTTKYSIFSRFVKKNVNYRFIKGTVKKIKNRENYAAVKTEEADYKANWVFDSIFDPGDYDVSKWSWQYFFGYELIAKNYIFESKTAELMDFRFANNSAMDFAYILPYTANHALIEAVSLKPIKQAKFEEYIKNSLKIQKYKIKRVESGSTPLTSHKFPRKAGKHVMNIGIKGGRIKPSTGYGFYRILKDSRNIVHSLKKYDNPFRIPPDNSTLRYYDRLMLYTIKKFPDWMPDLFKILFRKNKIDRIFRFLNEELHPFDLIIITLTLSPAIAKKIINKAIKLSDK